MYGKQASRRAASLLLEWWQQACGASLGGNALPAFPRNSRQLVCSNCAERPALPNIASRRPFAAADVSWGADGARVACTLSAHERGYAKRARSQNAPAVNVQAAKRRTNFQIESETVRLVDGGEHEVVTLEEAVSRARAGGLDLVEVSAHPTTPVCRIADYKSMHMKESAQKRKQVENAARAAKDVSKVKGLRVGHNIAEHDLRVKLRKLDEFLDKGHAVTVSCTYTTRQGAWREQYPKAIEVSQRIWREYSERYTAWFDYNESGNRQISVVYSKAPIGKPAAPFPWEAGSKPPPFMLAMQREAAARAAAARA